MTTVLLLSINIIAFAMAFEPVIKKIKGIWVLEYNSKEKHNHRKKIKICI